MKQLLLLGLLFSCFLCHAQDSTKHFADSTKPAMIKTTTHLAPGVNAVSERQATAQDSIKLPIGLYILTFDMASAKDLIAVFQHEMESDYANRRDQKLFEAIINQMKIQEANWAAQKPPAAPPAKKKGDK